MRQMLYKLAINDPIGYTLLEELVIDVYESRTGYYPDNEALDRVLGQITSRSEEELKSQTLLDIIDYEWSWEDEDYSRIEDEDEE